MRATGGSALFEAADIAPNELTTMEANGAVKAVGLIEHMRAKSMWVGAHGRSPCPKTLGFFPADVPHGLAARALALAHFVLRHAGSWRWSWRLGLGSGLGCRVEARLCVWVDARLWGI